MSVLSQKNYWIWSQLSGRNFFVMVSLQGSAHPGPEHKTLKELTMSFTAGAAHERSLTRLPYIRSCPIPILLHKETEWGGLGSASWEQAMWTLISPCLPSGRFHKIPWWNFFFCLTISCHTRRYIPPVNSITDSRQPAKTETWESQRLPPSWLFLPVHLWRV